MILADMNRVPTISFAALCEEMILADINRTKG